MNWCNPGRHHCGRCECQMCEFCDWEDDNIAWMPYPPPSPSPPPPTPPPFPKPPPSPKPPPPNPPPNPRPPPPPPPHPSPPSPPPAPAFTSASARERDSISAGDDTLLANKANEGGDDELATGEGLSASLMRVVSRIPPLAMIFGAITLGLTVALLVVCALRARSSVRRHRVGGRASGKYGRAGGGIAPLRQRDYDDDEDDEGDAPFGYDDDDDDDDDLSDIQSGARRSWDGPAGRVEGGRAFRSGTGQCIGAPSARGAAEDSGGASILGVHSIPAIYKTADGACAVDIPLAGVSTIRGLLEAVVHLGTAMVDADISAATIKVHYALAPGVKPTRITRDTTLWDLREATGLVVTPRC